MKHTEILKQSWDTVWNYRALWVFGVILALVTLSWETAVLFDDDRDWGERGITITQLDGETFGEAFRRTMRAEMEEANDELKTLLADEFGRVANVDVRNIFGLLLGLGAVAYVAAKVARYVSETAIIRMVGLYQETGERVGLRQGLRLGWSVTAWRLFLVDLLITLLAVLIGIAVFTLIFAPLPLWVNGPEAIVVLFAFLTGGMFFIAIAALIVGAATLVAWRRLARQACAVDGLRAAEALQRSLDIMRRHLGSAGLTWLVNAGVNLGWTAAVVPLLILLFGAGIVAGAIPGLAAIGLASGEAAGETAVYVGLAVGLLIFALVLFTPLALLAGLREVFISSLWTLTYQGLRGLDPVASEDAVVPEAPGLETASAA